MFFLIALTQGLQLPATCEALREAGSGAAHVPLGAAVTRPGLERVAGVSCWLSLALHQRGSWLFAMATHLRDLPASEGSSWSPVSL